MLDAKNLRVQLSSEDIVLKPVTKNDLHPLTKLFSSPQVNRFFLGGKDALEFAQTHIHRSQNPLSNNRENFDGLWMIEFQKDTAGFIIMSAVSLEWLPRDIIGSFDTNNTNDLNLAVGYALFPNFEGHGIASRALKLTIGYANNELEARHIFASTSFQNYGSIKVLKKNGFKLLNSNLSRSAKFFRTIN